MTLAHFECILETVVPANGGALAVYQQKALESQDAPSGVNFGNQLAHRFSAL
jgi:hypothetical protein